MSPTFFPLIWHSIIQQFFNCVHLGMSQKKNNGRRFAINLDDDENCVDFGFDEDFNNVQNLENFTLSVPLM
jgi:hypothetical protein